MVNEEAINLFTRGNDSWVGIVPRSFLPPTNAGKQSSWCHSLFMHSLNPLVWKDWLKNSDSENACRAREPKLPKHQKSKRYRQSTHHAGFMCRARCSGDTSKYNASLHGTSYFLGFFLDFLLPTTWWMETAFWKPQKYPFVNCYRPEVRWFLCMPSDCYIYTALSNANVER